METKKTEETAQELETKKNTAMAVQAPRKLGLEEPVDNSDLIVPRAMLIQYTPPKNVVIDESICRPGTVINSLTALPLGVDEKNGIPIIPIIRGVKWVMFNPQKDTDPNFDKAFEPGAKIWESRDPEDPRVREFGDWKKDEATGQNIPPRATKFIEFLVMVSGESMPLVLGFAKTSFQAGKQLSSMVNYTKKPAIFHEKYRLSTRQTQNDEKQKYYVLTVQKIGDATPDEVLEAQAYHDMFVGKKIKAHGDEDEAHTPVADKQPWE